MFYLCIFLVNKEKIFYFFQLMIGIIRLLIVIIVFGMGVDCKGVYRVIYYGFVKNVEVYIQEIGRVGRDGVYSVVYILYYGIFFGYVDGYMKQYIYIKNCRRKELLKYFNISIQEYEVLYFCCDNCVLKCKCGLFDCKIVVVFFMIEVGLLELVLVKRRIVYID